MIGRELAHYTITASLGAGGMGEVYRATDTKLNREAAIKVLPDAVVRDSDRLARFEREAQLLAALNHPNIAAIYGLEESEGTPFLALELVEGEDLAERLQRGALPVDEALEIGAQIAEALEAAHNKGIVHRDLKPANVKITPDGRAKVLDFGLAKACADDDASRSASEALSQSPTRVDDGTMAGVILGTAAYMSPEQARGKPVDKRADVWSFGVVLWEMLTGRRLFRGDSISDIIAVVLTQEPELDAVPDSTPWPVRRLLARCLRKDPRTRLPDIGAARLELQDAIASPSAESEPPGVRAHTSGTTSHLRLVRERRVWATALIATAGLVGVLAWILLTQTPEVPPAVHFTFDAPQNVTLSDVNPLAVSPDGGTIVFAGRQSAGEEQLWVRSLDTTEIRALPGTEGAGQPFWSADGSSIGFFGGGELRKLSLTIGKIQRVCELPISGLGPAGTWNQEGTIVFSPGRDVVGLFSVPAAGGEATPLTTPEGKTSHWWPQFLPDGRRFIFEIYGRQTENKGVYVASLDAPDEWRHLLPIPMRSRSGSGHLLYVQDGNTLLTQAFDGSRAEITGDPVVVAPSVATGMVPRWGWFSASDTGVLAYLEGNTNIELVWLDREGRRVGTLGDPGRYHGPIALSPDDSRVAAQIVEDDGQSNIWVVDAVRGIASRVNTGFAQAIGPIWSPDGSELLFEGGSDGGDLYRIELRAGATASPVLETARREIPQDWSRVGDSLLYLTYGTETELWALHRDERESPRLVLRTGASVHEPQVSPDGRWLAYASDESGRSEIYVEPFLRSGERVRVSPDGGGQPKWRGDGKELFYLSMDGGLLAVDVQESASGPAVGIPAVLVPSEMKVLQAWGRDDYAVSADGQRFLVKMRVEEGDRRIHVILNWTSLLE